MDRSSIYFKGFIALVALGVFGYLAGTLTKREADKPAPVISYGEADIGGPFELLDTDGARFTDRDLLGKYALVYFGYTHCPDVCPVDMNRISMVLEGLEEKGISIQNIQPVFITVDPARDTPEVVARFLEAYHPAFIGLTGTQEQMETAARAYKVYYEKILMSEHTDDGDMALMNHSSFFYLMGPDGKYRAHFGADDSVSMITDYLAGILG